MPDKWQYWQDIGFVYYWNVHDYRRAAEAFKRGADVPGAPWWMQSLAATTLAQGRRSRRVASAVEADLRHGQQRLRAQCRARRSSSSSTRSKRSSSCSRSSTRSSARTGGQVDRLGAADQGGRDPRRAARPGRRPVRAVVVLARRAVLALAAVPVADRARRAGRRVTRRRSSLFEAAYVTLLGLLLGSFMNVCIYRLPRGLSPVRPRSGCPKCGHMLAWYENVPIVSYLVLRGRCRQCRAPISLDVPDRRVHHRRGVSRRLPLVRPERAARRAARVRVGADRALRHRPTSTRSCPTSSRCPGIVVGILLELIWPGPAGWTRSSAPRPGPEASTSSRRSTTASATRKGSGWATSRCSA